MINHALPENLHIQWLLAVKGRQSQSFILQFQTLFYAIFHNCTQASTKWCRVMIHKKIILHNIQDFLYEFGTYLVEIKICTISYHLQTYQNYKESRQILDTFLKKQISNTKIWLLNQNFVIFEEFLNNFDDEMIYSNRINNSQLDVLQTMYFWRGHLMSMYTY